MKHFGQLSGFVSHRLYRDNVILKIQVGAGNIWKLICRQLLRSYSNRFGSEGLRPQLIRCAPFPSIAPYFRILYLSYLKIQMAIEAYPKVWTTIV